MGSSAITPAAPRSCVVIPTYNEVENIPALLESLAAVPVTWIVIVDDRSTDGTITVVQEAQQRDARIHLVVRQAPRSFAHSYRDGFEYVLKLGADKIIQMDADGSHHSADVQRIMDRLDHFDMVIGSRYVAGGEIQRWGLWRRLISRGGNIYARILTGLSIQDLTAGFNGWRRQVLANLNFLASGCDGYIFQVWLKHEAIRRGYTYIEIPITFTERRQGISKFHVGMVFESVRKLSALRRLAQKNNRYARG